MLTAGGAHRLQRTGAKGIAELFVQIITVGYQNDSGGGNAGAEHQAAGQHYHGKRLPRPLRMPDDPAFAGTVFRESLNPRKIALTVKNCW